MAEYFKKDGDNFVEVSEKLLPQSDVDGIIEKRLERERGKYHDYDTLKETAGKVESIKSDYESKLSAAGSEKSELEKSLAKAKLETEKVKITHEFKLSDELADFVSGDTVEDMRAKAEKLSKGGTGGGTVIIDKKPKPGETQSDSKQLAQGLFGKKSD